VTTGLRQGELFGLQWADVNLQTGMLAVRRTLIEVGGKLSFGPPKSKSGTRAIRLPAVAVEALTTHRAEMMRDGFAGASVVFCDTKGGPLRRSNFLRKYFKPLLERAGVPDVRFHDLRHTSATLMLADNIHPKIVQQRLGHSQIALTLDTYSHVLPSMDEAAAGTFDRLFKRNA